MARLKPGSMITLDPELTTMRQAIGALPWPTAQMGLGKHSSQKILAFLYQVHLIHVTACFYLNAFLLFFQARVLIEKVFCMDVRLFSCGTSKDGESYLVEWNESEGAIKRTYSGFRKRSSGVVQFDTTRNRFLAAGDEFLIKFWDMDNTNLLTTIDAEGGLPVSNNC